MDLEISGWPPLPATAGWPKRIPLAWSERERARAPG